MNLELTDEGFVKLNGIAQTGLNPALRAAYYPAFTMKTATLGPKLPRFLPHRIPNDLPLEGKARGQVIDKQVAWLTDEFQKGVSWDQLLQSRLPYSKQKPKPYRLCRYIREKLIPYLRDNEFRPWATQYPVCHPTARVGTALDLVCLNEEDEFVIFEIKVGFERYYHNHTGHKMQVPLSFLTDSTFNQHQLYIAFACDLFKKSYPALPLNESQCAVLRMTCDRDPLDVCPAPLWGRDSDIMSVGWMSIEELRDLNKRDRQVYTTDLRRTLKRRKKRRVGFK